MKPWHVQKKSRQLLLFLKLDFSKACEIVDWDFFFLTIASIRFSQESNDMVRILFNDAKVSIKTNRALFQKNSYNKKNKTRFFTCSIFISY